MTLYFEHLFVGVLLIRSIKGDTSISPEIQQACNGGVIIERPQGLILSPNFPRHYDKNISCNWTLISPKQYHTGVGYCGKIAPADFSSMSNVISVIFNSDLNMTEQGFIIGWQFKVSCLDDEFSCWSGACIRAGLQCDQNADCPDGSDEIECAYATEDDLEECGVQSESPRFPTNLLKPRIVLGSVAVPDSWPWQARLRRSPSLRGKCGGSVISHLMILTAAHCVDENTSPEDIVVQLGTLNMSDPEWRKELYALQSLVIHPRYSVRNYPNDIAVLILKKRITYSSVVRPICMLNIQKRDFEFLNPSWCVVTGYGDIDHTAGKKYPEVTYQTRVPISNQEKCVEVYRGIRVPISDFQLCADGGNGDACQGDSGGPLTCLHRETYLWYQAGIVSFGVSCSDDRYPGVYSRVSAYSKWIKSEMKWAEACNNGYNLTGPNRTMTSGTLTSPNYPNNYFKNLDCVWTILSQTNRVVRVDFTRFKMGDVYSQGVGDFVKIYNDGTEALTLFGTRTPEYMMSDTNNFTIVFHSDDSLSGAGFMFSWQILKVQEVANPNAVGAIIDHAE